MNNAAASALLHEVFPIARFASPAYLDWLYDANPAGLSAAVSIETLGHNGCIAQRYHYQGKPITMGLSLNTAVSEKARGRGMFGQLLTDLATSARNAGFSHIVGVANGNSTHGFVKNGFRLIRSLPVRMGLFPLWFVMETKIEEIIPEQLQLSRFKTHYDNEQIWSDEILRWRLASPACRYRVFTSNDALFITTITHIHGVKTGVILKVFASRKTNIVNHLRQMTAIARKLGTPFLMYAGFNPHFHFAGINLPQKVRPTPLNLIVKTLDTSYGGNEQFSLDCFEFLDFDAY